MLPEIITALDQERSHLSEQSMLIAVESLKQKLAMKERTFNCIVLADQDTTQSPEALSCEGYDSPRSNDALPTERKQMLNAQDGFKNQDSLRQWFGENESNELATLLMLLKINIDDIADNTKIQVIIGLKNHWFNLDISIIKGQLNFFLIDAADLIEYISPVIATINSIYPNAIINVFKSNLQRDIKNCGYFALDIAVTLSKIVNLYSKLPPRAQFQLLGENSNEQIKFLSAIKEGLIEQDVAQDKVPKIIHQINFIFGTALPKTHGSLLKNIQSLRSTYIPIYQSQDYLRHNQQSVDDYISSHLKKSPDGDKTFNNAIEVKKQEIKRDTLHFVYNRMGACMRILEEKDPINKFVKNLVNKSSLAAARQNNPPGFFKPLIADNIEKTDENSDDTLADLSPNW